MRLGPLASISVSRGRRRWQRKGWREEKNEAMMKEKHVIDRQRERKKERNVMGGGDKKKW